MPEEQKKGEPKTPEELREKISEKKKVDSKELIKQIATREILERDYKQDLLSVIFNTAPGRKRLVEARKPTPKQMTDIMRLSAEATVYENRAPDKKKCRQNYWNLRETQ
jgi:hypothetical protein